MPFFSTRAGSITIASLFAVILIAGAWYASGVHGTDAANAASTEALLKSFAAKDTDGDGLPDWEESLYGTDPAKTDTFGNGMTDAEAVKQGKVKLSVSASVPSAPSESLAGTVPGTTAASSTLTDQFSRVFFDNYMQSRGGTPPSEEEMGTFVENAVQSLVETSARPDTYAASSLNVSGTGADALRAYAVGAEAVFAAHNPKLPYSELTYFSDAAQKNDVGATKNITAISQGYAAIAEAISKVPVPTEAAKADLDLVNSMGHLSATIGDLASVQSDPIRGMLGLAEYEKDAPTLVAALQALAPVFTADGVVLTQGEPGFFFYRLVTTASAPTP